MSNNQQVSMQEGYCVVGDSVFVWQADCNKLTGIIRRTSFQVSTKDIPGVIKLLQAAYGSLESK